MQLTIAVAATFASIAIAQSGYTESSNGTITCDMANATYCAGGDIIIRCSNYVGQAGNCNDNLSGYGGGDYGTATCWSGCGALSGLAACEKGGTVYPDSGASFASNATGVCPVMNSTTNGTAPASTGIVPVPTNGTASNGTAPTTAPVAGGSATGAASNTPIAPSASASASSTPYQGVGSTTSVSMMGASAVVGFVAFSAALAML